MTKGALINVVAGLALCLQCAAQSGPAPPAPAPPAPSPPKHGGTGHKKGAPNSHTTHKKSHGDRHHQPNVPFAPLTVPGQGDKELAFVMGSIGTVPYGHHVTCALPPAWLQHGVQCCCCAAPRGRARAYDASQETFVVRPEPCGRPRAWRACAPQLSPLIVSGGR